VQPLFSRVWNAPQIAAAMELSSQTVKNDLSRVFQKVQMSSRAEAQ